MVAEDKSNGPVRALSLSQPWASMVALGIKTIETRSWKTDYRGRIAIHAAQSRGPSGEIGEWTWQRSTRCLWRPIEGGVETHYLPSGAIVATADLEHVMPTWHGDNLAEPPVLLWASVWDDDPEVREYWEETGWWMDAGIPVGFHGQKPYGDFSPGRYAWLLSDIDALSEPIPVRGKLGLWTWERETVSA